MSDDKLSPAYFELLMATWVLASRDESNVITYEGISRRLGIGLEYARGLVRSRQELFRLNVRKEQLQQWKDELARGVSNPVWLPSEAGERKAAIDALRALIISNRSTCGGQQRVVPFAVPS